MRIGYRARVAMTSVMIAFGLWGAAPPLHKEHRPGPAPKRAAGRAVADPDGLYSVRALRRARLILQLRLLELRKAHLERVRRAIEAHLPVDRIIEQDTPSPNASPHQRGRP
ncbi:MAG: hypothetical protein ACYDGM_05700 [Vulcanimicrobiaceae bacterium]